MSEINSESQWSVTLLSGVLFSVWIRVPKGDEFKQDTFKPMISIYILGGKNYPLLHNTLGMWKGGSSHLTLFDASQ